MRALEDGRIGCGNSSGQQALTRFRRKRHALLGWELGLEDRSN